MSCIFAECSLLKELPDISNWFNIRNFVENPVYTDRIIKNYSEFIHTYNERNENTGQSFIYMFYNCSSLETLPNISKWKIDNIIYAHGLFYGCSSLISIPDISKWNMDFVIDISEMFYDVNL